MNFLDKVKKILIEQLQNKIESTNNKIQKLEQDSKQEGGAIDVLYGEIGELLEEKGELEPKKNVIDNKIKSFNIIKRFAISYPKIKEIVEEIEKKQKSFSEDNYWLYKDEIEIRRQMCSDINELNKTIQDINKRNRNYKMDESLKIGYDDYIDLVDRYYNVISNFPIVEGRLLDRETSTEYSQWIKAHLFLKKQLGEDYVKNADDDTKKFLELMEPLDLWIEIEKYYTNIQDVNKVIEDFVDNIDFYQCLYEKVRCAFIPRVFKLFYDKCNQIVDSFKKKDSELKAKNAELHQRDEKKKRTQSGIESFSKQQESLRQQQDAITEAQDLQELGFKDKKNAAKKLKIDIKEYIVIPIPNNIQKISDLFNQEKKINIEARKKKFMATYISNTTEGYINSFGKENNSNAVLLLPIDSLRRDQIASVKNGEISLTQEILENKGISAIIPTYRKIDFEKRPIKTVSYTSGDIKQKLKEELGEDYTEDYSREIDGYDIFKGIADFSSEEKKKREEIIRNCLFENVHSDIKYEESILVDGEQYHWGFEDVKNLSYRDTNENIDEKKIDMIADNITKFLSVDGKKEESVDKFYQELLLEYLRVEKKAKAEYNEEEKTTVNINGKEMSIKPILPTSNEKIARRYTRKDEDIAYKTMKLAKIVNRFAHMTEEKNEELSNKLFNLKMALIDQTLILAQNNPRINIKYRFDDEKMTDSVIMKIPGYSMIALHLMSKGHELGARIGRLEKSSDDVISSSMIITPGVNEDFLRELQKLNPNERIQSIIDLDTTTFEKLALRMGYDGDTISSKEDRKKFIKDMISDKKIKELLKEQEELEK